MISLTLFTHFVNGRDESKRVSISVSTSSFLLARFPRILKLHPPYNLINITNAVTPGLFSKCISLVKHERELYRALLICHEGAGLLSIASFLKKNACYIAIEW